MEYKLLGVKFNVINVILCIALGFFICAMLGYNNKKIIEGARAKRDTQRGGLSGKKRKHQLRKAGDRKKREGPTRS
jgi:hypothetical protein